MLGERDLHLLDQLGSCVRGRSFHCLANEILLVDGKIPVFVVGRGMFRVNELARRFLNFCYARTSAVLN